MDTKCMSVIENEADGLQRSELMLNTIEQKGKGIVVSERSDEESVWSECPDHMLEVMFSSLPVEFSSRFRIVCKEWNTLLSSNRFLSSLPEGDPWILRCSSTHAMAYCFLTQSWKTISLRFLPSETIRSLSQEHSIVHSSGAGLLLIARIRGPQKKYIICNPLTSTYRYLPTVIANNVRAVTIMDNGESYKIVGLSNKRNPTCIQIYNCFEKSWQIEVELPLPREDFSFLYIVCVNGLLIYTSWDYKIVVWNVEDKRTQLVPFPEVDQSILRDNMNIPLYRLARLAKLAVCGSSFLFILIYLQINPDQRVVNSHLNVWELKWENEDMSIWTWREVTRMPPDMCQEFIKAGYLLESIFLSQYQAVNVGNFLCLTNGYRNTELFVYSLHGKCWSRIKLRQSVRFQRYKSILGFQPKPDMKV
ncbi:hypothetical protein SUGI_1180410 [Cryptomeria japonica]|uniref:F-box/kelch-repeat protein At5g15710-like n=1 Tax=Cryptomeria japonica TaxID=3369 RepID=UPI0024147E63|nr:F-box/kelch-repeat protein At5g15710-like [Cryptomeria japonica]GLJ54981.1 hypothetical protein SUGI_1180410 [Cryptomeria japonica]